MKSRGYELREALDFIASGALAGGDANLFLPHVNNLLYDDPFLVLADYQASVACQARVSALWLDPVAWAPPIHPQVGPDGQNLPRIARSAATANKAGKESRCR